MKHTFFFLILFLEGSIIFREIFFLYFFSCCFNSFEEERTVGGCPMSQAGSPARISGAAGPGAEGRVSRSDAHSHCSNLPCRRTDVCQGVFSRPNGSRDCQLPSTAAAHEMSRSAERSCPHLQASWAAVAGQACVSTPHRATGVEPQGWMGPGAASQGANGRDGLTAVTSHSTCCFPHACKRRLSFRGKEQETGFLCACVDSVIFSMIGLDRFGVNICVL